MKKSLTIPISSRNKSDDKKVTIGMYWNTIWILGILYEDYSNVHNPACVFWTCPNRNIKMKNFKDFKNLKPHRNLNIFHEASLSSKN